MPLPPRVNKRVSQEEKWRNIFYFSQRLLKHFQKQLQKSFALGLFITLAERLLQLFSQQLRKKVRTKLEESVTMVTS